MMTLAKFSTYNLALHEIKGAVVWRGRVYMIKRFTIDNIVWERLKYE